MTIVYLIIKEDRSRQIANAHFSGNWNNSTSNASTTYWNLNNSSTNRNRNNGTHQH